MRTPVHWWPFTALIAPEGVLVIGIEGDGDRARARVRIREAIHDALLALTGNAVTLHGDSGEAPWALGADGQRIGLSISHEAALSIAAINLHGPIGVDMLDTQLPADALAVALDYLGPEAAQALTVAEPQARPAVFTAAWTDHEARLKCLGIELGEWDANPLLAQCQVFALDLPEGLTGTLALKVSWIT
ncbi:4-phosphopantetheinyl transferase [Massilia sp. S19_KUP03_FR1]|uniref:4-phosphopantetheinyl transferase n=1 Tax=Massilia sp. S19_KUP03_FR1 TaxID=3025503 RepID=UPI002FCDA7F0